MAHLIRSLAAGDRVRLDHLSAALILVGGLLAIGAGVYRVFVEPELTFEEARQALWPFVAAGVACVALGWIVDRSQGWIAGGRVRRRLYSLPSVVGVRPARPARLGLLAARWSAANSRSSRRSSSTRSSGSGMP
jgi:hypothetical protein